MPTLERWKPNVTVAAIVEQGGNFLMVQENINGRIVYNQPAGHWDFGETLIQAVIRETLEETAWHVQPTALISINQWQNAQQVTYLRFCFCGQALQQEPQRQLDEDIIQALWMSYPQLQQHSQQLRSPMVLHDIDRYRSGHRYDLTLLQTLG